MKNRPTVSLPDFSAVIGKERIAPRGCKATNVKPCPPYILLVTNCTSVRLICRFRGAFFGFRNILAIMLIKPLWSFEPSFIPETGSPSLKSEKILRLGS